MASVSRHTGRRLRVLTLSGPQETDYIMSYFDNGEDFGGDSDDNMDEAVY